MSSLAKGLGTALSGVGGVAERYNTSVMQKTAFQQSQEAHEELKRRLRGNMESVNSLYERYEKMMPGVQLPPKQVYMTGTEEDLDKAARTLENLYVQYNAYNEAKQQGIDMPMPSSNMLSKDYAELLKNRVGTKQVAASVESTQTKHQFESPLVSGLTESAVSETARGGVASPQTYELAKGIAATPGRAEVTSEQFSAQQAARAEKPMGTREEFYQDVSPKGAPKEQVEMAAKGFQEGITPYEKGVLGLGEKKVAAQGASREKSEQDKRLTAINSIRSGRSQIQQLLDKKAKLKANIEEQGMPYSSIKIEDDDLNKKIEAITKDIKFTRKLYNIRDDEIEEKMSGVPAVKSGRFKVTVVK